ncbi:hypothetical protein [Amylibacter sp. IMCC11727]|uniref:hypothetical protein n=1 Tax=Amylibacter sp. IMCC11727 TaxID=3039851 RepID=UPI00244DF46C|nr:hypothetical protein [Amylibacter sp. IMCC11727]WGI21037.1 hypothetical protein QBD29_13095 [Amylibacter sp. IMCC11727]
MELVVWIFGILLVAGVGIAIWEKRTGKTVVDETDPNAAKMDTAQRDVTNAQQMFNQNSHFH